jgi:pyruvate kinase
MVKTKIVATLGPVSSNKTVLRKMMLAGLDVVRLNFSHGSHEEHLRRIALIRELNRKYRRRIKILGDLEGYRIRIGSLKSPVELQKNQILWLTQQHIIGGTKIVPFDYVGSLKAIRRGQSIFIDDGNIHLVVVDKNEYRLKTRVIIGGILKEHKGINIPGAVLRFCGLSEKDQKDVRFCIRNKIDYIAQSFVSNEGDILKIRNLLKRLSYRCNIIAKIENRQGLYNIEEIIRVSDGIMIARGDLGVSFPIYEVPLLQKKIIRKCRQAGKPVITATQMLESMTENIRPTRAEVSDVANAIIDGSDYLMLSAETAVGKYPVESVLMMNQVIKFTERHLG